MSTIAKALGAAGSHPYRYGAITVALALAIWVTWQAQSLGKTLTIVASDLVCTQFFAAQQPEQQVVGRELPLLLNLDFLPRLEIDHANESVVATVAGLIATTSKHRPGYGCATFDDLAPELPQYVSQLDATRPPWDVVTEGYPAVQAAVADRFRQYGESNTDNAVNLRALIVMHRGKIVAEQYDAPFDVDMRQASFSMAKSVNATLFALADGLGLIDLDAPARVPEWKADNPRARITNRHLIDMVSGLDYREDYSPTGDTVALMTARDRGAYIVNHALVAEPGQRWLYSDADSNTASRSLRLGLAEHGMTTVGFAEKYLFGPIGANSVVLGHDQSGSFVGSSLVYATPRDWAKLGQLYLQGGVWDGRRIVPEAFVAKLQEPVPTSKGQYRQGMWLNYGKRYGEDSRAMNLPEDAFYFGGYLGQFVVIVPSSEIVIVRLGASRGEDGGNFYNEAQAFIEALHDLALSNAALARRMAVSSLE
ncbi:MAG: serine hydrolase [Pseudomonadota bacterium]